MCLSLSVSHWGDLSVRLCAVGWELERLFWTISPVCCPLLSASFLGRLLVSLLFWGLDSSLVLFISPSNSHRTSQTLRKRTKVGNSWLALILQSLSGFVHWVCSLRVTVGIPRLSRALGALTQDQSLLTAQFIACITSLCFKETGNLYSMKPISPYQAKITKFLSQSGSHWWRFGVDYWSGVPWQD